jgi:hypothetical protein
MKKSKFCNLSDETRKEIFSKFDEIQKLIKKYESRKYWIRFSEPRKRGQAYRCKWWMGEVSQTGFNKIAKSLPEGWVLKIVPGRYHNSIQVNTCKYEV